MSSDLVGALAANPRTLKGMRPLAILPDNITTDHLSPSNAILMNSAAGEYLHKMGLPEEDFNSYATHRGDHLTAMRATFANPTLKNEMVRKEDGSIKVSSDASFVACLVTGSSTGDYLIGARYDTMDPNWMRAMAGRLPHGQFLYLPNGSHMAFYDDQDAYFAGLIRFLHGVEGGRRR